ncbi:MAG: hypothetical protein POELPBGB_02963 [Bacteroidia bacterium]|nr:hypothetical protein [Bacteroidia bacterium]
METDIKIICIESEAYYRLIDRLIDYIKLREGIKDEKWITPSEAKKMLNVKSDTTMQTLKDKGLIRFSGSKKNVVFDRHSILEYLEKNAKNTF